MTFKHFHPVDKPYDQPQKNVRYKLGILEKKKSKSSKFKLWKYEKFGTSTWNFFYCHVPCAPKLAYARDIGT